MRERSSFYHLLSRSIAHISGHYGTEKKKEGKWKPTKLYNKKDEWLE
jgi:hypothetical protein